MRHHGVKCFIFAFDKYRKTNRSTAAAALLGLLTGFGAAQFSEGHAQSVSSFTTESDGALCVLSDSGRLKVQVCGPKIIRIVHTRGTTIPAPQGLVVGRSSFTPGSFNAVDNGTAIVVATPQCTALVTKSNTLVTFKNTTGTTVCNETARALYPVTRSGQAGDSGTITFNSPSGEGVYGLGNLSESSGGWTENDYWCSTTLPPDRTGQLNIRGFSFDMHQTNWMDVIPFFMTTSGYGVLMNFCCRCYKASPLTFRASFLLNGCWDYFFFYGPQFDTVIAGYRYVTGPAPMPPKWALGWWQCKNAYTTSGQLTTAAQTYRQNNIPLDCIVQDWGWWTAYGNFTWNSSYSNASSWISTLHNTHNCHFALSIWPTFVTSSSNYGQMSSHLISTSCNSGTAGYWMNAFDTVGLNYFWGYMSGRFNEGVDAWWMDATEPECNALGNQTTSWGAIETYANAYAASMAKTIYEKQRAVSTAKRVVNLTRSFYGGQQRFGTYYWNGDLSGSDMGNVATTVSGGLNLCMAGFPYWSSDIGGFQNNPTDEILTRWFEAGTFFPIFRVHGSRNTEIYNMAATPRATCTRFSNMRYRLMPYIYSLAWKVTHEGYTMTRALPFDFPGDANVYNIADQFMFGPALLINPVHVVGATARNVYLPAGTWYNFWTGATTVSAGATQSGVSAPLTIIPIYARAGAILPMGPRIQYATQSVNPIEIRVYPGADGSFTLYEDQGDGYAYETGSYATIPMSYSNATGKITIGPRSGSFSGMLTSRTFNIVFVTSGHGIGDTVTTNPDCVVNYTGVGVTACPVTGVCAECAAKRLAEAGPYTMKTAEERISFPSQYSGLSKEVAVYDVSGRLLQKAVFKKQTVSLRKDLGLPAGTYIVKVRMVP
jgi:alpha-D-xyloside xylohydrolase